MFSLSSEAMECIIRELGNACAAHTFRGCAVLLHWGDVLPWNIYKLQGCSGNSITWLKVYVGFGLGKCTHLVLVVAFRWPFCGIYVIYLYLFVRT
jgi:hypothetical protein